MSTLLVIGGTGFFGKSILDLFRQGKLANYGISKIIIGARRIDSFFYEYPELVNKNVELLKIDINTCDILPNADFVIHAATSSETSNYFDLYANKLKIEKSITNYCRLAKIYHRFSKIVYCSSGAVYGQQSIDVEKLTEENLYGEFNDKFEYKKNYSKIKIAAEKAILDLSNDGLNVSIARCFSFYGKYLPRDQHFAYGNFISAAEKGGPIIVTATHPVIRSYMHADDMVHALIRISLESNIKENIYNVGSSNPIEIRDLAKKIALEYNVNVIIPNQFIEENIDRYIPDTKRLDKINEKYKF